MAEKDKVSVYEGKLPSPYSSLLLQTLAAQPDFNSCHVKNWNVFNYLTSDTDPEQCKKEFNWIQATAPQAKITSSATAHNLSRLKSTRQSQQSITRKEYQFSPSKGSYSLSSCSSKSEISASPKSGKQCDSPYYRSGLSGGDSVESEGKEVSICVLDDSKNTKETFSCPWDVLIKQMPYFKDCLDTEHPEGEVQISVHCDVLVFRKLMDYINRDSIEDTKKFRFEPKYAIHLLVSADFLQMTALVEECLHYCHRHMNTILESSCPVGALNDSLLGSLFAYQLTLPSSTTNYQKEIGTHENPILKFQELEKYDIKGAAKAMLNHQILRIILADMFSHREVEALEDPLGKIKEKLYRKLLERLLKPEIKTPGQPGIPKLLKCSLCDQVFATKLQTFISCKHKRALVGPRGELMFTHKRDLNWDRDQYLEDLHSETHSWRQLYWRIWGLVNCLHCVICGQDFACSDFTRCRYHKDSAKYLSADEQQKNPHVIGTFPCCGQKSWKFDPLDPLLLATGCSYRNHSLSSSDRHTDVFQDMLTYFDLICLPQPVEAVQDEWVGLNRIIPCFSEKRITQWSQIEQSIGCKKQTISSQIIPVEGSQPVVKAAENLTVYMSRRESKQPSEQSSVFTSILSSLGHGDGAMTDVKQIWKPGASLWHNQDAVREHDSRQMELLMSQFQKMQSVSRVRHNSHSRK